MTFYLRSICQRLYVYSIFIACQLCFVRSHNHTRLFSFTNTDIKSPADIKDSCLTIESTLGIRYQGLTLDLLKASSDGSCQIWDFELNGIRKNIVRDKHDRRLCRTKFTLSINNTECVQTVQHICQENDINSIYFQECVQLDLYEMDETTTKDFEDSDRITMSELPVPTASSLGPVYDIPKTHCNIKRINSDNSYDQTAKRPEDDTDENQGRSDQSYGLFAVLGSGLAGLIIGVLITSLTCILIQKRKNRNVNDVLSPESSLHLMVGRERKFSIHSKEDGTIYHDISDIPGSSKGKAKCALQSITNVQNNDEYLEQRYSESPKSSTSVNGKGSLSSLPSSKNITFQPNEPSVSIQRGQVYHTLSKDDDIGSTKKEKESTSDSLSFQKTLDERVSSEIGIFQTIPSENNGLNPRETENTQSTEPNDDSCYETPQNTTEALPGVYHVLQEKKEEQADSESSDIPAETTENQ